MIVLLPTLKLILFQSSNICFVFVFCMEYSARHRHMQSLIYLYAFPVFSCCKHVYFCQMQPWTCKMYDSRPPSLRYWGLNLTLLYPPCKYLVDESIVRGMIMSLLSAGGHSTRLLTCYVLTCRPSDPIGCCPPCLTHPPTCRVLPACPQILLAYVRHLLPAL